MPPSKRAFATLVKLELIDLSAPIKSPTLMPPLKFDFTPVPRRCLFDVRCF